MSKTNSEYLKKIIEKLQKHIFNKLSEAYCFYDIYNLDNKITIIKRDNRIHIYLNLRKTEAPDKILNEYAIVIRLGSINAQINQADKIKVSFTYHNKAEKYLNEKTILMAKLTYLHILELAQAILRDFKAKNTELGNHIDGIISRTYIAL